jgi:hypothetical protein
MKRGISMISVCMLSISIWISSCKKEDNHDHEGELITTVQVKLKDKSTNVINMYTWKDVDGDGGNTPVIQPITLSASKTYEVELDFLDESKNPAEDITEEIRAEADDHEVFYQLSNALVIITRTDKDTKNLPLGLKADLVTSGSGSATLTVILKHKPGTKAAGDNAIKGESDIEVSFPLTVN